MVYIKRSPNVVKLGAHLSIMFVNRHSYSAKIEKERKFSFGFVLLPALVRRSSMAEKDLAKSLSLEYDPPAPPHFAFDIFYCLSFPHEICHRLPNL